jgi:hypothetical protein
VAAGIAVGVCVGLVIIRGTGKKSPATGQEIASGLVPGGDKVDPPETPKTPPETPKTPPETPVTPLVTPPITPPVTPDAGAAAPTDPQPPVVPKLTTVTFAIAPPEAAASAKITVDGKDVAGAKLEVEMTDKPIRVVVKASGYNTYDKRHAVTENATVNVTLKKRSSGGGTSGPGGKIEL